jgi:hypothetical protein
LPPQGNSPNSLNSNKSSKKKKQTSKQEANNKGRGKLKPKFCFGRKRQTVFHFLPAESSRTPLTILLVFCQQILASPNCVVLVLFVICGFLVFRCFLWNTEQQMSQAKANTGPSNGVDYKRQKNNK